MNLSEKKLTTNVNCEPMTQEAALSIIARAGDDPFLAPDIDKLREKCCEFVAEVMRETTVALSRIDKRVPALLRGKPESVLSLAGASREREVLAMQRRELAEAMVIGALMNSDNPDWNPLDPDTAHADGGSILLAMLKSILPK